MSSGGSTANIHPSNPRLEAIATRLEAIPYFWGYYKGPSMALQYQDWAVRLVSFDQFDRLNCGAGDCFNPPLLSLIVTVTPH